MQNHKAIHLQILGTLYLILATISEGFFVVVWVILAFFALITSLVYWFVED